jgi:hypothetical protein
MDAYTRSTLLPLDAFQYGLNTFVPDGMEVGTRPGADLLGTVREGKIQGAIYFDTASYEQLIIGSAGKLWSWNGSAWTELTGFTLTDSALAFSAAQGVDKALFTDGAAQMQSWSGAAWSGPLGSTDTDPPVGATILLWHAGRMWAAGFGGATAGKEDDAIWGSNQLDFGSGAWNKTDRNIRIGNGEGDPIVGLASLSSSFDNGYVMAVLKRNSIWLVNTDPTATFTNFTANLGPQQVGGGVGTVGKRSFCVSGNDLIYVSPDKTVRSLARMASAQGQYEISAPLSLPIQSYMRRVNWNYGHLIACVKYGEYILISVPLDSATAPNTVFAFNARLQKWVGIWTGWTANCWEVTFFNGVPALAFGENGGNVNVWKDTEDETDDDTYKDNGVAIATKLNTRALFFGEPLNNKDAYHAETRFGQSNALVNVTLVADNVDIKTWQVDARSVGPSLEIDLDFDLVSDGNRAFRKGLRGLTAFNECYLKLESTAGWWRLRNASLSAFVNTLQNQ